MSLLFDRTGFPSIPLPLLGIQAQLLPVTKVQLERFLAEPNHFGDCWYEEVLNIHPRVSHLNMTEDNREGLFLTGVLPEEAREFARWMGEGWNLPSFNMWRKILLSFSQISWPPVYEEFTEKVSSILVKNMIDQMVQQISPQTLLDVSLMSNGIMEWVYIDGSWGGLGKPRHTFFPNLYDCWSDNPIRLIPKMRRDYRYGFRLICAL